MARGWHGNSEAHRAAARRGWILRNAKKAGRLVDFRSVDSIVSEANKQYQEKYAAWLDKSNSGKIASVKQPKHFTDIVDFARMIAGREKEREQRDTRTSKQKDASLFVAAEKQEIEKYTALLASKQKEQGQARKALERAEEGNNSANRRRAESRLHTIGMEILSLRRKLEYHQDRKLDYQKEARGK